MGGGGKSKQKTESKSTGWQDTVGSSTNVGSASTTDKASTNQTGTSLDQAYGSSSAMQADLQLKRQDEQFGNLLTRADELLGEGGFYDPQYGGGAQTYAGWTPEQQQMFSQLTGEGGVLQGALGGLQQTLGPYDPNNANIQAAIDATAGDISRNFERNVMTGIDQSATGAGVGQFSGSRAGIAEGLARSDMNQQISDMATGMRLQDYQTWQGNQQNALMNAGNIAAGLQGIVGMGQQEEQARLDDLFSKWQYESGVQRENLGAFKSLISGDMGGVGIGSSVQQNVNTNISDYSQRSKTDATSQTDSTQQTDSTSRTDYDNFTKSKGKSKSGK